MYYSALLIAMIESGKRSPSRKLAELFDVVFDEPGTFARAERRLRDVPFPASFRPFTVYEAEAAALRWYEHALVPGLLRPRSTHERCCPPGRTPPRTK